MTDAEKLKRKIAKIKKQIVNARRLSLQAPKRDRKYWRDKSARLHDALMELEMDDGVTGV